MNNLAAELVKQIASYLDFNEERQLIATSKYNKETLFEGILRLNLEYSIWFLNNEKFMLKLSKYKLALKVNKWYKSKSKESGLPGNVFEVTLLRVHIDDREKYFFREGINFVFKGEKEAPNDEAANQLIETIPYVNISYVQSYPTQRIGRITRQILNREINVYLTVNRLGDLY